VTGDAAGTVVAGAVVVDDEVVVVPA